MEARVEVMMAIVAVIVMVIVSGVDDVFDSGHAGSSE